MSLQVSQTGGDFEIVPAGVYVARCFKVIDLGTQDVVWSGETKQQRKVMVTWEILDDEVKMEDGRPFAVTKQYTASLNENSHLYKDLVSWRGKAFTADELISFDISKLVGAYCQVQIVHSEGGDRTYANVNTIMSIGKAEKPKGVNPDVSFDVDNPDMELFNGFSDWLKAKIRASHEWRNQEGSDESTQADAPEDVPTKDIEIEDLEDDKPPIKLEDVPF